MGVLFNRNRLEKKDYARIIQIVQHSEIEKKGIYVNSIESIKGREGCNCLFILTADLAEYLLGKKKANNKTKNKLYVALTRSSEKLTILITREVEEKYGRKVMNNSNFALE
jgi:ATP-dependent exoDNAse (exonuclease V) beta subunit